MGLRALNFNTTSFAELPECLKVIELVFDWVGDDDSGPEDCQDDEDLECEKVKIIIKRYIHST